LPHLSKTAYETWDKIVETVFLALLATTLGTLLALPVSFLAARNLMRDVKSPLSSIALSILGMPLGFLLGYWLASWVGQVGQMVNANLGLAISGVAISPLILYRAVRWALPQEEGSVRLTLRVLRLIVLFFIAMFALLTLYLIAALLMRSGGAIISGLGKLAFLGNFIIQCGDILMTGLPAITALAGGLGASSVAGRFGQVMIERVSMRTLKGMNLLFAPLAGATLFGLLGAGIVWLYELKNPLILFGLLGAGAALGLFLAWRTKPKDALPIGIYIYYITRTILNAVRSIEALIMAIVAVIWVGIGPFAGVLALGLHTVAALAKLYSEQIESILPGPIEAVQATGANRLQTVIYAVVPQIIPPYISFTMYRWDINVRMSTIIGFAGGGGIGFLLQQNINLLNYRAASTQMLAIAIVVATMDYLSSTLREKFV
jgi:phosphonate ABC transporter permease subunit PhnE